MNTDTIAAIATAMSSSGIGIVRISGEQAFSIMKRIFRKKNNRPLDVEITSHTVHYVMVTPATR